MRQPNVPAPAWRDYWAALTGTSRVHTYLNVLDRAGDIVTTLAADGCDGQVLVDRRSKTTSRMLTLSVDDPTGQLEFDPGSPDEAAVFLNHMVQVKKAVWVEAVDRLVTDTIFTGPMHRMWRDGATVHLTAHGKDKDANRPLGDTLTIEAGTPKMEAIAVILARIGETRFAFPELDAALTRTLSLGPASRPWPLCQLIAESENHQLLYRADGIPTARAWSRQPLYTFRSGVDLVGRPRIAYELDDDFGNAVEVLGAKLSGVQQRIRVVVPAPYDHLLASGDDTVRDEEHLGLVVHRYVNDLIDDEDTAGTIGERMMDDILLGVVRPRFESVPIWPLEEGDMAEMEAGDVTVPFRLDRFTLPVSTTGRPRMVVGVQRKTTGDRDTW